MAAADIFTRVESREERDSVYNYVIALKAPLTAQTEGKIEFSFVPVALRSRYLSGKVVGPTKLNEEEYISLMLPFGEEMFFLRSRFSYEPSGQIVVDLSEPLYKLQRREYFRVKVRGLKGSVFKLEKRNSDSMDSKMTLVDFSGGGIAVEVPKADQLPFQMGDAVAGQILIPGRADETVVGEVRYMRAGKSGSGQPVCRFGIQFKNVNPTQQHRVAQVVFEIHREFFSKFDSYNRR